MKVYKLQENSMSSVENIKNAFGFITDCSPKIVILPATMETTKHLEKIAMYLFNRDIDSAHKEITKLEFKFIDLVNELFTNEDIKHETIDSILDYFRHIWNYVKDEFTSANEHEILSQGEFITNIIMSHYLKEQGIDYVQINVFDFMRTGLNDEPDMDYIQHNLQHIFQQYPDTHLFITQGGLYKNAYNEIHTFKSGGGNHTSLLIGSAIEANEILIWTDLQNIYKCHSETVNDSTHIKHLSFEEAEQLIYFGAKELQSFCIAPVCTKNIPIRLLNSSEPTYGGILISNQQDDEVIKAVASKDAMMYVKFKSNNTLRSYLFISKILTTFAKHQTPLRLLTSSNTDVSVAIDTKDKLPNIVNDLKNYAQIFVESQMSLVSVIGNLKWQYAGAGSKVIEALRKIPLRMISYGSNNSNLSIIVKTVDRNRALQSLNSIFLEPGHAK